jgi:hypothetical protein
MPESSYVVNDGDCLSSIAEQFGFLWQTIWDANPELKELRKNPNVLYAGDVVKIPSKGEKSHSRPTDNTHKFVMKGIPAKFRLIVEQHNVPLANRRYVLRIDDKVFKGQTDGTGLIEVSISPSAQSGYLQMPDDQLECKLQLGNLDPVDQISGVQQRLQNLGFLTGELTGEMDEETETALMYFQSSVNLPPTGKLDDDTNNQLLQMHDKVHKQQTAQDQPPEDANSASTEPENIEPKFNPEEDAAEMARFTNLDG